MTETDATRRKLQMPPKFLPYLEKFNVYSLFKEILKELIICRPCDQLKFLKTFLEDQLKGGKDAYKIMILIHPALNIDKTKLAKEIVKMTDAVVITRHLVMDYCMKRQEFSESNFFSTKLLVEVTKELVKTEPVPYTGWLMIDHPCTLREARLLQQNGVLQKCTVYLAPPSQSCPVLSDPIPAPRGFFEQDIQSLRNIYKATTKEVTIEPADDLDAITKKVSTALRACSQHLHSEGDNSVAVGAPSVYRIVIIGPRGSGRTTQASLLAKNFNIVHLEAKDLIEEAALKNDELGENLRKYHRHHKYVAQVINRRTLQKDCLDYGWVLVGYPNNSTDFEHMDNMETPPNRIIFLIVEKDTCRLRIGSKGTEWCMSTSRKDILPGSSLSLHHHPDYIPENIDAELETYFSDIQDDLHAATGMTSSEVNGESSIEKVQIELQSVVMATPFFEAELYAPIVKKSSF